MLAEIGKVLLCLGLLTWIGAPTQTKSCSYQYKGQNGIRLRSST